MDDLVALKRDEQIVTTLEAVDRLLDTMVAKIKRLQDEQAELRDELHELAADHRALYGGYVAHIQSHPGQ